jgi:hypothetical protein
VDRTQRVLAALLAIQIVLLLILHNPFVHAHSGGEQKLLPTLASITPEKIQIDAGDGGSLTLERHGAAWELGRPAGFPVAPGKVEKTIQDLEHMTAGRAVASDRRSYAALKVADDQFERRVRIWAKPSGAPVAELYLGSSPGAGVTHVRVGGANRVLEASGISVWDVAADPGSWIDRTLVPFRPEEVERFALTNRKGGFVLEKKGGVWRVAAPPARAAAMLDTVKVVDLVRTLGSVMIDQPIGTLDEAAQGLATPEATVDLQTAAAAGAAAGDSTAVTYRIGALVAGKTDARYAARSGAKFAVSIPQYSADRALSTRLEDLLKK